MTLTTFLLARIRRMKVITLCTIVAWLIFAGLVLGMFGWRWAVLSAALSAPVFWWEWRDLTRPIPPEGTKP